MCLLAATSNYSTSEQLNTHIRISYRIARFPHLSQARRAIPAPIVAVLILISLGGKISSQMTPSRTFELTRGAPVEPKKLDNIFLELRK